MFPSREILCGRDWAQVKKWKICLQVQRRSRKKKKEDILQILVIGAVECVFKIQRESKRQTRRAPSGGPDLFPSRWRQFFRGRIRALGWRQQNHEILKRRIRVQFHLWSVQEEAGEGLEADMEREEGGRAEAEPLRGRDKILCYINMQSPGRSSDLDQDQDQHLLPGGLQSYVVFISFHSCDSVWKLFVEIIVLSHFLWRGTWALLWTCAEKGLVGKSRLRRSLPDLSQRVMRTCTSGELIGWIWAPVKWHSICGKSLNGLCWISAWSGVSATRSHACTRISTHERERTKRTITVNLSRWSDKVTTRDVFNGVVYRRALWLFTSDVVSCSLHSSLCFI